MNRDEYDALIERAEGLDKINSKKFFEIDYSQRTANTRAIIHILPELTAALKSCLARVDELEQVNQHLTAQLVSMNDYYGSPDEYTNQEWDGEE